ncbi:MAG: 50S ribosomal protein L20 [Planctomycetes bacterium]|nr:50S ribosomal protein L20 [Planctomycetota bacterium]
MTRVRSNVAKLRRKRRLMKEAKGFRGGRSKLYRTVKETLRRARAYAFRDRRTRKRVFRSLWIVRINAACRARGTTYSKFVADLRREGLLLDRKSLASIALHDPAGFEKILEEVSTARKTA